MAAAMAPELLVPLEQGPFGAGNGLGGEEWDAALFGCLDDRLGPAHLFPSLDPDPMFDCAFDGGGGCGPPDPPWDQEPPRLFPDLEVKSEPRSPNPPLCSDPSGPSSVSETPLWAPGPPELGVKAEPEPPPPTLPAAPPDPGQPPRAVKAEGPPQPRRTPPPIQPKPPAGVPGGGGGVGGGTPSPPQPLLLQPLPGAAPPAAIAVPAPAVLLSPAELLLPGVLCLPPPRPARGGAPPSKPEAKTIVPAPSAPPSAPLAPQEVDARAVRRQQRMIKNRESACQSRRRRKEYVAGLEQRLRQALADNEGLRRENGALRSRLDALLARSSELRPGPSPRKLACVAALLLLAFHLGPLSLSQPPPPLADPPQNPPPRGRRHLLGVPDGRGGVLGPPPPSPSPSSSSSSSSKGRSHELPPPSPAVWGPPREPRQPPRRTPFRNSSLASLSPPPWDLEGPPPRASDCRRFNRTESLRLAAELRGWVRRHQIDRGEPGVPSQPPQFQASASAPPWKAPGPSRFVPAVPPHPQRTPPGQLQLFQLPEPRILAAIDRRDDTFYVVSFRRDHLLLPAISHNKTSRPKMSLVMPAAALNESLSGRGRGLEAMMQVDCEVMDTRVIHVRRRRSPSGRTPLASRTPPLGNRTPPLGNRTPPLGNRSDAQFGEGP